MISAISPLSVIHENGFSLILPIRFISLRPMKFFLFKSLPIAHVQRQLARPLALDSIRGVRGLCGYSSSDNYKKKKLNAWPLFVEKSVHSNSRPWTYFAIPTVLLVVAGAGLLLRHNDQRRATRNGAHQGVGHETARTTNRPAFGGPFRLVDADGHIVTESDLRGNWMLLYFGYTSSPDVGPEEVQKMAKAIDKLESEHNLKIKPVFITIDPQRDTPSQLRAYLNEFDPRILGLTGPIDAIRQTALEYRVFYKKVEEEGTDYLVATSHNMYLMEPSMEIVKCFTVDYSADQLCEDILKEVRRASDQDKHRTNR